MPPLYIERESDMSLSANTHCDEDFFDVSLACDDEQIQAHKVIISAPCPLCLLSVKVIFHGSANTHCDENFFDVTLAWDDEQIQAHKVIFSASRPLCLLSSHMLFTPLIGSHLT